MSVKDRPRRKKRSQTNSFKRQREFFEIFFRKKWKEDKKKFIKKPIVYTDDEDNGIILRIKKTKKHRIKL